MRKKWKNIAELCMKIAEDSTMNNIPKSCFKGPIIYAPNMGYRSWIFHYKNIPVVLCDLGNGHYDFYSAATWFDILEARIVGLIDMIIYGKR